MNRRALLIASACAIAWSSTVLAQPRKPYRIGYIANYEKRELSRELQNAFRTTLKELGYAEGRDYVLEVRSAEGRYERLPELAADLVRAKVDVIVSTVGSNSARAAQRATRTIPVVMASGGDPVAQGFAKSLARPGGNMTGVTNIAETVGPKHIELLLAVLPKLTKIAVLVHPDAVGVAAARVDAMAREAGLTVMRASARNVNELQPAFDLVSRERAGAVIVLPNAVFNNEVREIARLAIKHRVPAIGTYRQYAEAGVLMSYGGDIAEGFRRAAVYVDKILKGANPAELPIEQPTRIELAVNLKTAAALGLAIPQSILVRADRVIE